MEEKTITEQQFLKKIIDKSVIDITETFCIIEKEKLDKLIKEELGKEIKELFNLKKVELLIKEEREDIRLLYDEVKLLKQKIDKRILEKALNVVKNLENAKNKKKLIVEVLTKENFVVFVFTTDYLILIAPKIETE